MVFNEMRRSDRALNQQETEDILATGTYGILSIVGTNNYGYGVPLSYIYKDNSLYIHCALEGQKLLCLRNNNKVSFCIVTEANPLQDGFSMKYRSVIVFGKTYEISGDEKVSALIALVEKYASDDNYKVKGREKAVRETDRTVVLKLDVEHITGKARK